MSEEDAIMGRNEGLVDRGIRITIAMVALVAGLSTGLGSLVSTIFLVVAAIMFITGVVGFCPLYTIFRINTSGARK
ncbi:MAG TPA: DUF2892 domain-containing protein [Kineosporiaceae bacterium]|nr:DUF2892 domain-containing protein [Kineosporiaceae bacterium]